MPAKPFLDSNVLIYAFLPADFRQPKANALLAEGGTISVQTLNEFVNVSRRKLRKSWAQIEEALGALRMVFDTALPITFEAHEAAIALARDHNFSIYDALIVASAQQAGCAVLYSENMQHGRRIGSLTIQNPFL